MLLPSFASELRRQLAARTGGTNAGDIHRRVELAGLVDAAGESDGSGVTVRTPSAAVARSVVRLWRSGLTGATNGHIGPDASDGPARVGSREIGPSRPRGAPHRTGTCLREAGTRPGSPAGAAYLAAPSGRGLRTLRATVGNHMGRPPGRES